MKCFYNFEDETDPKYVSVEKCQFVEINSEEKGGCISETRAVTLSISCTLFLKCSSTDHGGAFYLENDNAQLAVQKTCFASILSETYGGVYFAKCDLTNSFLNSCFQNRDEKQYQIVYLRSLVYYDRQTNFSDNTADLCPTFYFISGTLAKIKDFSEINSYAKTGALIDMNGISNSIILERVNCIKNKIENDTYGLLHFFSDTLVELFNVCAFGNLGCKTFLYSYQSQVHSYDCYTDYTNPSTNFLITGFTYNSFESLEDCALLYTKYYNKRSPIINVYFSFLLLKDHLFF